MKVYVRKQEDVPNTLFAVISLWIAFPSTKKYKRGQKVSYTTIRTDSNLSLMILEKTERQTNSFELSLNYRVHQYLFPKYP